MTLHLAIFIIYFLIIFAIGWISLKKTQNESDYWIAGGKLGWFVGGATMTATHTSAGTFVGTIGVIYTVGWSFGWVLISIPLAYFFMVAVLAPRFTRLRQLTLPAFIESRYDSKSARAIAAVIILIATVVYIMAQIVAGGLISNVIFGIPPAYGMVIFTIILLAYTTVGGMIAVVYTDLIQLIIMVIGTLVAVPLAVSHFQSLPNLLLYVNTIKPTTFSWDGMPPAALITVSMAFFLGSIATPEKVTRLFAMKDMPTIRRGILMTIILTTALNLMVFILGLSAMVLFPMLPNGDLTMPIIAKAILPPFIGTLMLAAITSAMMSTVDSLLLVAGSALSEDIYRSMVKPEATQKQRLKIARAGIFIVGTIPLILVLLGIQEGELVQFIVILFTALMGASFFVPVVGGVIWKRANKQGAIAAMVGGVTTSMIWEVLGEPGIEPILPGFLVALVLFVGVSLFTAPPKEETVEKYFEKIE